MRAVAFALSLLVLGSVGAAAQQPSPMPLPELNLNPRDVAAIGIGAVLGFFGAEAVEIPGLIGAVAGSVIGAWWYADHDNPVQRPEIKPTAAREAVAPRGETLALVLVR
jgi:hypothetical protein